ncbi:hypothetical protein [Holophaga foetida]|uniref:hypothetical protein n=1 Tax=Holophaga foetida TaxID=35839 RepID=UPI00024752F7|nr:hypothetical protein [Holophaga foetida]
MAKAFVIMPFSGSFDDIYNLFILETLTECGYSVYRADDINNSQNIISDIIQGIATSDLIIADLTGANPNVFYELGIAHALKRPTILLVQDIAELPFDLRSYRVISYSTDFVKIRASKEQLSSLATEAIHGRVHFGNPVSDFAENIFINPSTVMAETTIAGLLDHVADLELSLDELTSVLNNLAQETFSINDKTIQATAQFERFFGSANERRQAVKGYALDLANYSNRLKKLNSTYSNALFKHENSINNILSSDMLINSIEDRDGLLTLLKAIHEAESGTTTFLLQTRDLCGAIETAPDIERTFILARDSTTKELRVLIQNLEKTASIFARSRAIGNGLISDFDAKQSKDAPVG